MKKRARVDFKSSCSAIFPFCYLLLLISSVYLNTRQAEERIFNPLVQVEELPLLNRNRKELITTACEQLSSTEGAPTLTRSLVSIRSSFDLELTYNIGRKRDIQKTRFPVLRTWLKREKKTGLKEISLSTIELDFYIQIGTGLKRLWILLRAGFHSTFISGTSTCTCNIEFDFPESLLLAYIHIGHS